MIPHLEYKPIFAMKLAEVRRRKNESERRRDERKRKRGGDIQ
jgi:hypothetical protein